MKLLTGLDYYWTQTLLFYCLPSSFVFYFFGILLKKFSVDGLAVQCSLCTTQLHQGCPKKCMGGNWLCGFKSHMIRAQRNLGSCGCLPAEKVRQSNQYATVIDCIPNC